MKKPRRVLVTGASGTLGYNIVRLFARDPDHQLVLPLRTLHPELFHRYSNVHMRQADLSDTPELGRILRDASPDVIIHCAAVPECHFIYISTGLAYRQQGRPLRETDPVESLHPYGVSKAAADLLLQAAAAEFGRTLTILRPFSFTGLHDGGARLFPSLLNAAVTGEPFRLSPGEQVRDFCAVDDIAAAVLAASQRSDKRDLVEIFNVGSGLSKTIRAVVEEVCGELELPVDLQFGALPYPGNEPMHLVADLGKIEKLGWRPNTPLSYAVWQLAQAQTPELKLRQPERAL
jgi:nucleoside-diphosphate-sugar epimerase